MATAVQLRALVQSFADSDDERFYSCALQVAAHEARVGHSDLAKELRDIVDLARQKKGCILLDKRPIPIVQPQGELGKLLSASFPKTRLADLVLSAEVAGRLERVIREQRQVDRIQSHGLSARRKFLLIGPPGTGKTYTASALAGELHLLLFVARIDAIVTKFMGETSAKLRLVFDALRQQRGIYLFDEFDSIGTMRTAANDVGEVRRILNSFFHLMDEDSSESMILAATNHPDMLDDALFRRFDDVIEYTLPDAAARLAVLKNRLAGATEDRFVWRKLVSESELLSHAEIVRACDDALKESIVAGRDKTTQASVLQTLAERRRYHDRIFRLATALPKPR
jgi:SpoVK/Ycf46/Vps4 family AAA+-type ATPase